MPPLQVSMHLNISMLWDDYLAKHQTEKKYKHFDYPRPLSSVDAYVCDPNKVATHSFFPFIHKQFTRRRISKSNGKIARIAPKVREINFCCHLDRCVYQRYSYLLGELYESFVKSRNLEDVAIAYRSLGKSNLDFAVEAFDYIVSCQQCFVFVTDFSNFFDNIAHGTLKQKIKEICNTKSLSGDFYAIYKNITKYSYIDSEDIKKVLDSKNILLRGGCYLRNLKFESFKPYVKKNRNSYGIPQGAPISAVLSNIYMIGFDEELNRLVKINNDGKYFRYCDDILIVVPINRFSDTKKIQKELLDFFTSHEGIAKINGDKTDSFYFSNGQFTSLSKQGKSQVRLDYLGLCFDGLSRKIREKSIGKYLYRSRRKAIYAGKKKASRLKECIKNKKTNFIYPKNLYDRYSTCSRSVRNKSTKQRHRSSRNFLSYLRRALPLLVNDSASKNILLTSKKRISYYMKLGAKK